MTTKTSLRLELLEAKKKALKDKAAQDIIAIRKALADKAGKIKADERKFRSRETRDQKKRDDHAKILLGVAAIHLNQTSDKFREFFDAKLNEFYGDAPLRLETARYGLSIAVKKPSTDAEKV
jgi:hypothetical protein